MSKHPRQAAIFEKARQVKILVLDVDGVLTDGRLYFSSRGEELKAFNIADGHGIKMLQESGVKVALLTGRESLIVTRRAAELGIELVLQNQGDKLPALDLLLGQLGLRYEDAAYVGDDLPDLPCIRRVALGVTVPNAHPLLREHAFCQTSHAGGAGAVREVCDWIMQAQGSYARAVERYF